MSNPVLGPGDKRDAYAQAVKSVLGGAASTPADSGPSGSAPALATAPAPPAPTTSQVVDADGNQVELPAVLLSAMSSEEVRRLLASPAGTCMRDAATQEGRILCLVRSVDSGGVRTYSNEAIAGLLEQHRVQTSGRLGPMCVSCARCEPCTQAIDILTQYLRRADLRGLSQSAELSPGLTLGPLVTVSAVVPVVFVVGAAIVYSNRKHGARDYFYRYQWGPYAVVMVLSVLVFALVVLAFVVQLRCNSAANQDQASLVHRYLASDGRPVLAALHGNIMGSLEALEKRIMATVEVQTGGSVDVRAAVHDGASLLADLQEMNRIRVAYNAFLAEFAKPVAARKYKAALTWIVNLIGCMLLVIFVAVMESAFKLSSYDQLYNGAYDGLAQIMSGQRSGTGEEVREAFQQFKDVCYKEHGSMRFVATTVAITILYALFTFGQTATATSPHREWEAPQLESVLSSTASQSKPAIVVAAKTAFNNYTEQRFEEQSGLTPRASKFMKISIILSATALAAGLLYVFVKRSDAVGWPGSEIFQKSTSALQSHLASLLGQGASGPLQRAGSAVLTVWSWCLISLVVLSLCVLYYLVNGRGA
ncbi:hypothetical protein HXX76_014046 [Chlamydomonas incerta]|uniref:Uncharacterized protein n=1 Tax=Chlamydomonas incerta TaxID=51695 RepID=A0A835VT50_CHLIN|nr:hypothetical protein HXX76_014046 [Chlamydomonas incerta]|eukprot:KAG2424888.1 hypothetical protein HXX76_014046 [Chlamydomonas incerta]